MGGAIELKLVAALRRRNSWTYIDCNRRSGSAERKTLRKISQALFSSPFEAA